MDKEFEAAMLLMRGVLGGLLLGAIAFCLINNGDSTFAALGCVMAFLAVLMLILGLVGGRQLMEKEDANGKE